ncbi:hypothetical protein C0991_000280 [Blastosporella zonata]|nr:hypothetical protein C0991_000280 [Blastosporella zonata]
MHQEVWLQHPVNGGMKLSYKCQREWKPSAGEIRIADVSLTSKGIAALHNEITFYTQHREEVYTSLSVADNIMWGHAGIRNHTLAELAAGATGCLSLLPTTGIVGIPFLNYQSFGQ